MAIFLLLDYNKMVQFIYQQAQVNIIVTTVYISIKFKIAPTNLVTLPLYSYQSIWHNHQKGGIMDWRIHIT